MCAILFSRSQNLLQDILVIDKHPMSPSDKEIGAFLLTHRKLLIKLFGYL